MVTVPTGLAVDLNDSGDGTSALGFRRALAVLFKQSAPGVATAGRLGADHFVVAGTAGMEYTVSGGGLVLVRSSSAGAYLIGMPSSVTVATQASNGVNPRIDRIYALAPDPVFDGSTVGVDFIIDVVSGAPAASPSLPALPAGAFELSRKLIAAGAANTQTGAPFTDVAPVTGLNVAPAPTPTKAEMRAQAGIYTGSGAPASSLGDNGDIYFQRL